MKRKNNETKILILGSYNSGKTTTLENICEKKLKVEYKGTTIALDYGNIIINEKKIHIFASPGQERFKFMRQILAQGLDGAIVVIDSSKGMTYTDESIIARLNKAQVPYVIFANKQDIKTVDINHELIKGPIIPTVAIQSMGIKDGLNILLEQINK